MIGYYVHHHGAGHRFRFEAVAALLGDVVALSELEIAGGLRLPSDVPPGAAADPTADGAFHWAPLSSGAARRLRILTDWLASREPCGVVIDVSVEAAVACRLAGVPTAVVRQLGGREDRAHQLGYRVASRLVAAWPEELDDGAPDWVRKKTEYVGYLRHELTNPCRAAVPECDVPDVRAGDIVVLWGRGGGRLSVRAINSIARSGGGTVWCLGTDVVDDDAGVGVDSNVAVLGWRNDVDSILRGAPVVVASAGDNTIAAAARWSCPLVLVPQCRPFAEQDVHARGLAALGAAVVVDDAGVEQAWSERFSEARSCSARLGSLYRSGGAQRFADAVLGTFGCG